ncbi:MAG TPA: NAD(P)/FAD-dependent oxidoreductase [Microbacteriaceae bacterium]|nr:NAD(P)/FAD-dependent oxidoreductase [Microbacteriaceae bacterium]
MTTNDSAPDLDLVIVGAGFAGIHMLQRAEADGLRARVYERGAGIGGTWYWNRYPGARCDFDSFDYSYEFDPELEREWVWSERYPSQPEILRYLDHVVDRYGIRDGIRLSSPVTAASWDETRELWTVTVEGPDGRETVTAKWLILAVGALSRPQLPDYAGLDEFDGIQLVAGDWPEQDPDLAGKRIAVMGTGSSGVQVIPPLAAIAERLTVLVRTPSYVVPARNHPVSEAEYREILATGAERRERNRNAALGVHFPSFGPSAKDATAAEREVAFQSAWDAGGSAILSAYDDLLVDIESNDLLAEWLRAKARDIVHDPAAAATLTSQTYPVGARRIVIDTEFYETFNRENVDAVDLNATPIDRFTAGGVRLADGREIALDAIVFATGYDAGTGPILAIDIVGRDGLALREAWAAGPATNLGLQVVGFPNLFMISGPQSPSIMANVVKAIEQHVPFLADLIAHAEAEGVRTVEADPAAQAEWGAQVDGIAQILVHSRATGSWYFGANVPGKPKAFIAYAGGIPAYRSVIADVAAKGYEGFILTKAGAESDG